MKNCRDARVLIYRDRTKELNQMSTSINFLAPRRLFEQCIGMPAYDGEPSVYKWSCTEFSLFFDKKVELYLTKNGLMYLSGYLDTKAYQEQYSKGKSKHEVFAMEMIFLGVLLGLEFVPDDFHQQMVFTKESTEKS